MTRVRKISIESNAVCYGPVPKPEDEIFQHLTINSQGRVWLHRYCFGHDYIKYTLTSKEILFIGKEKAREILDAVEDYCNGEKTFIDICDIGTWDAKVVSESGEVACYHDSLSGGNKKLDKISEMIRKALGDDTIFAFNGARR